MKKDITESHRLFFETLGNDTRWDIVHVLKKSPRNVTGIAEALGCEQSLTSHHLRRLEHCGFVRVKRNGKERIYTLNNKTIRPLLRLMDTHISTFCSAVALTKSKSTKI